MPSIVPEISFKDAAFDAGRASRFCLAMEVDLRGCRFVVLDNLSNEFLAFENYTFKKTASEKDLAGELEKLIREHSWLTNDFKRVDVMLNTERFTLVPSAFYDSSKQKEQLTFNHPLTEEDELLCDTLRNTDARLVYTADKKLIAELKKIHSGIKFHHQLTPVIEKELSRNKTRKGKRVLANIRSASFDVIISEEGKLLLANTFNYQSSEDFIYFLLYCTEQLKMNPDQMEVELAGDTAVDSSLVLMARKYIRNVALASRPGELKFVKEFEQLPAHGLSALFALHYFS